eukprot:CAMPEP_0204192220 /NCGR_PEP_ID=MMETSP0361-20130328/60703_1 /ASSEMBLY_ACC=CAM_ASM_000343 /TAXON_ID=268821 /ORGANISM="Scrippsiella Hangoei, Strain SHTV-5" /LENGTH=116 /DNA_ID=CAMNT_0051153277 /DNA_START=24 /DNA_END=371 /DNA_ORIENTATION=+
MSDWHWWAAVEQNHGKPVRPPCAAIPRHKLPHDGTLASTSSPTAWLHEKSLMPISALLPASPGEALRAAAPSSRASAGRVAEPPRHVAVRREQQHDSVALLEHALGAQALRMDWWT